MTRKRSERDTGQLSLKFEPGLARRMPDPARRSHQRREKSPYKVIAVGLYNDQAAALDRTAEALQQAGYLKATRSFIVQVLVRRLQQDIEGLGAEEIMTLFVEKYLRRPLASVPSRQTQALRPTRELPRQRAR